MRLVVTLIVAASLAGCASPGEDFEPTCPQWRQGLSTFTVQGAFSPQSQETQRTDELGRGAQSDDGDPLDLVALEFVNRTSGPESARQHLLLVQDGMLKARFFDADGARLRAYDLDAPGDLRHEWIWGPGLYWDFTLHVELAEPTTVEVVWDFERDLDGEADTPSQAATYYTATYWYDTC